jgi:hypothetical protein
MSADTLFHVRIPVVSYEWVEAYGVTEDDVRIQYPNAVDIIHHGLFDDIVQESEWWK